MSSLLDLARKNKDVDPQSWEELYKSMVVHKIRKDKEIDINDEVAVLRKAVANIIGILIMLHGKEIISTQEFEEMHNLIERCKSDAKWEMEYGK